MLIKLLIIMGIGGIMVMAFIGGVFICNFDETTKHEETLDEIWENLKKIRRNNK